MSLPFNLDMRLAYLTLLLSAAGLLIGGCDLPRIQGSGTVITKYRSVAQAFDSVELRGSTDVVVRIDPSATETSLAVTADDNLMEYIETTVSGSALVVATRQRLSPTQTIRVEIVAPSLAGVRLTGSGNMQVAGVSGRGFSARIYGSGDIDLAGEVEGLDLTVTGSGDIRAAQVDAGNVRARVTGSGNISLQSRGSADISITGSGNVDVHGTPDHVSSSVTGSGRVQTHATQAQP